MVISFLKKLVISCVPESVYQRVRLLYLCLRWGVLVLPKAEYKYNAAGLVTAKNCDFMKEPAFIQASEAGQNQFDRLDPNFLGGGGWVRHLNLWAGFHAKQLDGDFVECGVFRGGNAKAIMTYINYKEMKGRKYYLFDTFRGLDERYSSKDELDSYVGAYSNDVYPFVVDSFKDFPNVEIVRGAIPETLTRVDIKKVAFLSIDMNCVLPEMEALKFFWPKMVPGGIVVLDDYGWGGSHDRQKEAQDKFAESVGVKIFTLPTGQGMMIKP
ncbi:MAG: class I SAM-dependent methyltransferase [Candidatus Omnitrophica bacterium]|nr:class I SAM-dependent methyltransferase [Candidatus Omnitrophota bacterium]